MQDSKTVRLLGSVGEGEGGMSWENSIETFILPYVQQIASPGSKQETGCSGCSGCSGTTLRDGMGRKVGGGFRMGDTCTPIADFMSMYGKNHYNIVISLQLK